jgi:hypothetical protein
MPTRYDREWARGLRQQAGTGRMSVSIAAYTILFSAAPYYLVVSGRPLEARREQQLRPAAQEQTYVAVPLFIRMEATGDGTGAQILCHERRRAIRSL